MPFCHIDYASFAHIAHFSHYPSGTRFCPFLSSLMAFEGVSCYHRTLRPLKHAITRRQFSIYSLLFCHFPRSFLKKRWTFSQKSSEFFQKTSEIFQKTLEFFLVSSERRFLTANRNTNKAGNRRAASLEVQPLIARIDNFQAWTHNYNITRARRKFMQQRRR